MSERALSTSDSCGWLGSGGVRRGATGWCIRSDRQASSEIKSETRGDLQPTSFVVFSAPVIQKRRQTYSQIAWTPSSNRICQKVLLCSRSTHAHSNRCPLHSKCHSFWPDSSGATLVVRNYIPFGKIRPVRRWSIETTILCSELSLI